jgi:hypothetical protein
VDVHGPRMATDLTILDELAVNVGFDQEVR